MKCLPWALQRWCLVVCVIFSLIGCGGGVSDAKKNLVPVTGKVTIDGKPLTKGSISFLSTDEPGKAYTGVIDSSGNYSLAYSPSSKGAQPGNYSVAITAVEGEAKMGENGAVEEAKSLIPVKYNTTANSGLSAKVESGGKAINFDLKSN